jgi:hypothetical protein
MNATTYPDQEQTIRLAVQKCAWAHGVRGAFFALRLTGEVGKGGVWGIYTRGNPQNKIGPEIHATSAGVCTVREGR